MSDVGAVASGSGVPTKLDPSSRSDIKKAHEHGGSIVLDNITYHVESQKFPDHCVGGLDKMKCVLTGGKEIVKKKILKGITGSFLPGRLTALLGPSGAGKSTLLDIIAQRKNTGVIGGEVLFNAEKPPAVMKRLLGYVEQTDVLPETMSVREALNFQTQFKTTLNAAEREALVQKLIVDLSLESCADNIIGGKAKRGISGGQLKRVNIACELVTKESAFLLLDEPTSGLDSSAALNVVAIAREIADSGRTVVATIHQPSEQAFNLFDDVVILQAGEVAFWGTRDDAVAFVSEITETSPAKDENPCDWLIHSLHDSTGTTTLDDGTIALDFSGKKPTSTSGDIPVVQVEVIKDKKSGAATPNVFFPEVFAASEHSKYQKEMVASIVGMTGRGVLPPAFGFDEPRFANSASAEFAILTRRFASLNFRNPDFVGIRIFAKIAMNLLMGALYFGIDRSTQAGVLNTSSLVFFVTTLAAMAAFDFLPGLFFDRMLFTRERLSGCYRVSSYLFSAFLVEALVGIITVSTFMIIYFMAGLPSSIDVWPAVFATIYVLYLWSLSFAYSLAAIFADFESAIAGAPMILMIFMMLSGYLILDPPSGYQWVEHINPLAYAFSLFARFVFEGETLGCADDELVKGLCPYPTGDVYLASLDMDDFDRTFYAAMLLLIVGVTGTIAYLSVRFINHMKK